MKRKHLLLLTLGLGALIALPSCSNDDDDYMLYRPTALVTVCPAYEGGFVMQLNDSVQLVPINMKTSPYGLKEVRALVNYTRDNEPTTSENIQTVHVNWLDSIRTKMPVKSAGPENDAIYGDDPIEIVRDWVTIAEDGYLTLRVRTLWGMTDTPHLLNLLTDTNPDNPFELELRHDAQGDGNGRWGDALIAFNLNEMPRPDSEKAKITLKWKSFSGDKSIQFEIKMRPKNHEIDSSDILYSKCVK